LRFEINAHHLDLYDHDEPSSICVVVYGKVENDELYMHRKKYVERYYILFAFDVIT